MPYGKKSPAKMGHKDSAMKMGHKDSAMKMESAKQEKYNLMHDNPVAKHGSWMSKHATPFNMGHESPAKMGHESPAKMHKDDHKEIFDIAKYLEKQNHAAKVLVPVDEKGYAAKVKEHDRKQGLLDPKTGKRKKKHTFDYNYAKNNGVITSKKTGEKSFVTASGKKLSVGPGSPAGKHCM